MAHTDFFDDDDECVAPLNAPPAAVPGPHDEPGPATPTATPTRAPKSLTDILASAPAFLAAELHAVVGALARGDPHMNVADAETDVEQSDEEGPTGTHSSAPPAPATSSSTAPAGSGLGAHIDIDRAAGSRGPARRGRLSMEARAALEEEHAWNDLMGEPPSDEEDSELEAEPRYTGRDAEFLPVAQRFNTTVWPRIERGLAGTSAISFRRYALAQALKRLGIPRRVLHISRGNHGRGYGDPENMVCLEPAGRNWSRRSRDMTDGTQDELFSSPEVAGDAPLELTPEEEAAAVEAIRLAQTKAAAKTPKWSHNMAICWAIPGDVEQHQCRQWTGEVVAGNCDCKGEHIAAMHEFASRGEPNVALDFVVRHKTRGELHKEAGRISRDLLRERSLRLITMSSSKFPGGDENKRTLRAVLVPLPPPPAPKPSPAPIVQCKGHVATGARCKITNRGDISQVQPLREGGSFCGHHLRQAPPATPPAQRVASQPTPEIATHFVDRKRGLDVAGPPHQGKRSLFT